MMKIIKYALVLFLSFFIILNDAYADEVYEKVLVTTSFQENLDLSKIDGVIITIDFQSGKEMTIKLSRDDNYSSELTNIPKETFEVSMGMVYDDNLGKFDISSTVEYTTETEAKINLVVKEKETTTAKAEVNKELLDKIFKTTTKNISIIDSEPDVTTKTTTTRVITNASGEIITTKSIQEIEKEEEILEEKEREINKKARNKVYVIIYSVLFLVILIIVSFCIVKISQANK